MGLKKTHQIFFAIPYDSATKELYASVRDQLLRKYSNLSVVIGTEHVGPSKDLSNILTFRSQNTELMRQFLATIKSSDIIVADLTNNNPNVHLELGIALTLNKNIFRVTGRPLQELGFDIKGFDVYQYPGATELFKRLSEYLDMFLRIKNLDFSPSHAPLYQAFPALRTIKHQEGEPSPVAFCDNFVMRDGKIKVTFRFNSTSSENDWFGVYFRSRNDNPWMGGYMINVRKSGKIQLAKNPGVEVLLEESFFPVGIAAEKTLLVEIEENLVRVSCEGSDKLLEFPSLDLLSYGRVAFGCYRSEVIFKNVEMINRDTIEEPGLS